MKNISALLGIAVFTLFLACTRPANDASHSTAGGGGPAASEVAPPLTRPQAAQPTTTIPEKKATDLENHETGGPKPH